MGGITPFRNQQLFVFLGPQSANKRIGWVLQGSSSISTPTCCTGHGRLCQTDFGQTDFGQFFDRLWPIVPTLAKPILANISVFVFWPIFPKLTDFGQNWGGRLWPNRLWPILVFIFLFFKKTEQRNTWKNKHPFGPRREELPRVWPRRVGPEGWGEGWGPEGLGART